MKVVQKKKLENNSSSKNLIVAGLVGIVAAGVGIAATLMLSDKKNQKKVEESWESIKDKIFEYLSQIRLPPSTNEAPKTSGKTKRLG